MPTREALVVGAFHWVPSWRADPRECEHRPHRQALDDGEPPVSFFVAGGTVPPGSPSYVERAADRELFDALVAGEFCYVLNSRQMGKSSLAVRTIGRLQELGVRTAFIDLTRLGGATLTPEQWYSGLLVETGRVLGLKSEAAAHLRETRDLGAAQRYLAFLQEVVLERLEGSVVVMIDEIDAVRSLPFSTDELFAGIRQLHNGRASDPALGRLTLCLLGAALPSDLIRDPRTTPFNVGRRVELRDFSPEESAPFAAALGSDGQRRLLEVLRWTGGHPFLTQTVCAELCESPSLSPEALVRSRYLDARARETDPNLADVGRRLVGEGDPSVKESERSDTLSLYERMLRGKPVADDESSPSAARIKMSGVARVENGLLQPRNRIYAQAFDAKWVRDNMPGQELLRQKRAFWKGALRVGAVASIVVAAIGTLAVLATQNAHRAKVAEERTALSLYESRIVNAGTEAFQGRLPRVEDLLLATSNSPHRNIEWSLINGQTKVGVRHVPLDAAPDWPKFSTDGSRLWLSANGEIRVLDTRTWQEISRFRPPLSPYNFAVSPSGKTVVIAATSGELLVWNTDLRRVDRVLKGLKGQRGEVGGNAAYLDLRFSPDGKYFAAGSGYALRRDQLDVYRVADWKQVSARVVSDPIHDLAFSPDGKYLAISYFPYEAVRGGPTDIITTKDWKVSRRLKSQRGGIMGTEWMPDSKGLITASVDGTIAVSDPETGKMRYRLTDQTRVSWSVIEMHAQTGRVFQLADPQRRGAQQSFTAMAMTDDGRLVAQSIDGRSTVYDLKRRQILRDDRIFGQAVFDTDAQPNGRLVVTACSDPAELIVQDLEAPTTMQELR
ncbi:hypothetical protein EON82_19055, partial [bacterium]